MIAPNIARLAGLSLLALAGMTVVAAAADQPATTGGYANLRNGPGTSYAVIDTLDPGTDIIVHACTGTWCAAKVFHEARMMPPAKFICLSLPEVGPPMRAKLIKG